MVTLAEHLVRHAGPAVHLMRDGPEVLARVREAAADLGLQILTVDLAGIDSKESLFEKVAASLQFPSEFGANWDALLDSLRDLSWLGSDGYLLVLMNVSSLASRPDRDLEEFVEILVQAAADWASNGKAFYVVFLVDGQAAMRLLAKRRMDVVPGRLSPIEVRPVCDDRGGHKVGSV